MNIEELRIKDEYRRTKDKRMNIRELRRKDEYRRTKKKEWI